MIGPGSIVTICKQQTGNHGNLRITNGKRDKNSGSNDNKNDMLHTPVLLPPPLWSQQFLYKYWEMQFYSKMTCPSLCASPCTHTLLQATLHTPTRQEYTQLAITLLLYLPHSPAASKSCNSKAQLLLGVQPSPNSQLIRLHSTLLYKHCRSFWRRA